MGGRSDVPKKISIITNDEQKGKCLPTSMVSQCSQRHVHRPTHNMKYQSPQTKLHRGEEKAHASTILEENLVVYCPITRSPSSMPSLNHCWYRFFGGIGYSAPFGNPGRSLKMCRLLFSESASNRGIESSSSRRRASLRSRVLAGMMACGFIL